jgi:hypothetical protein
VSLLVRWIKAASNLRRMCFERIVRGKFRRFDKHVCLPIRKNFKRLKQSVLVRSFVKWIFFRVMYNYLKLTLSIYFKKTQVLELRIYWVRPFISIDQFTDRSAVNKQFSSSSTTLWTNYWIVPQGTILKTFRS